MVYTFLTIPFQVVSVSQRTHVARAWKDSSGEIKTERLELGWFISLQQPEGPMPFQVLSFGVGSEHPGFNEGDQVEMVIRRKEE